jgi:hypothetical protein
MSFPANPSNGQAAIVNKITYQYSSATNTWTKLTSLPTYLANLTANNSITIGNLTMNGNLTNITAAGNITAGLAAFVGNGAQSTILTSPTVIAVGTSVSGAGQQYTQAALINKTNIGSSDFIAYANNYPGPSNDHGWVDVGFTGDAFNDPVYTITKQNDAYVFASGANVTVGGNLVLATDSTGSYNDIVIGVGSFYSNSEVARFHGNASTNGNLTVKYTTTSTSTTTGALVVSGGVGIAGNLYTTGNTVHTGNLTVSGAGNKLYFADGSSQSTAATAGFAGVFGQTFTTTGSGQTFTIPAGVTALKVTVVGGGGNGGSTSTNYGGGGGGGGAGISYLTGLTPGNTISVTVGAAGGASSISSGTQTIATVTATAGGNGGNSYAVGAGGSCSGANLNFGGSAGAGLSGITVGGASIFGGNGQSAAANNNGNAGTAYGAGGSGGSRPCGGGTSSGGAGYQGVVIFEW